MTEQWREVSLPRDLCVAAEQQFGRYFASLEDLLVFVLAELLQENAVNLDEGEVRLIEERLRELGYV